MSEGGRGCLSTWLSRIRTVGSQLPFAAQGGEMRTALCQNLEPLPPAWTLPQDDTCGKPGFPSLLVLLGKSKILFVQNVSRFTY